MTGQGHSLGTRADFHKQIKKGKLQKVLWSIQINRAHKRCSHVPIKDDFKKHKILMDGIYKSITYMLKSVVI